MDGHVIACIFCGGVDPNADGLLLQAAIAGGMTAPWILRDKLRAMFARLRGRGRATALNASACPIPGEEGEHHSEAP